MESHGTNNSIHVNIPNNEALNVIVASGPYMMNGTTQTNNLSTLLDVALEKKAHVLILVSGSLYLVMLNLNLKKLIEVTFS